MKLGKYIFFILIFLPLLVSAQDNPKWIHKAGDNFLFFQNPALSITVDSIKFRGDGSKFGSATSSVPSDSAGKAGTAYTLYGFSATSKADTGWVKDSISVLRILADGKLSASDSVKMRNYSNSLYRLLTDTTFLSNLWSIMGTKLDTSKAFVWRFNADASDSLRFIEGANITLTKNGNALTIASTGGGGDTTNIHLQIVALQDSVGVIEDSIYSYNNRITDLENTPPGTTDTTSLSARIEALKDSVALFRSEINTIKDSITSYNNRLNGKLAPSDSGTTAGKYVTPYMLNGKQAAGTYLVPTDSTTLKNSLLKNTDSTTVKNSVLSQVLKNADSTTVKNSTLSQVLKNADSTTLKNSVLSQVLKNADSTTLKNSLLKNIDSTTLKNSILSSVLKNADSTTLKNSLLKNIDSTTLKNALLKNADSTTIINSVLSQTLKNADSTTIRNHIDADFVAKGDSTTGIRYATKKDTLDARTYSTSLYVSKGDSATGIRYATKKDTLDSRNYSESRYVLKGDSATGIRYATKKDTLDARTYSTSLYVAKGDSAYGYATPKLVRDSSAAVRSSIDGVASSFADTVQIPTSKVFNLSGKNKTLEIDLADSSFVKLVQTVSGNGRPRGFVNYLYGETYETPILNSYKARGTSAAPTMLTANDNLSAMNGIGYDSAAFVTGGQFIFTCAENWTPRSRATFFRVRLTPTGSTTITEAFYISPIGNVGIYTITPFHRLSAPTSLATNLNAFNFYCTDVNKTVSTLAQATDTSSVNLTFTGTGNPTFTMKDKAGASIVIVDSTGITESASMVGSDAFTGTATGDTVAVTGASTNDHYFITLTGTAAPSAFDAFTVSATATGFIVTRSGAGTSGLTYNWMRRK
jgi:hypothetical protein